jgi:N-acyl-D-aspartate/D-glutamate deacylase
MDAVRKAALMPAQRLESMAPQMRQKGRLKVGADADIAVFDPARVADRATFGNATQYSDGFCWCEAGSSFETANCRTTSRQGKGFGATDFVGELSAS